MQTLFSDCGGILTLCTSQYSSSICSCSCRDMHSFRDFQMVCGPRCGVDISYWTQWSHCALLWTLLFVPLLSVPVSESPSPLSLLWLGFQLWMLPLTTSVIPQQPTYPCQPPLMCDLMYCLTVFPPFKINCSFISSQDKKKSLPRT